MNGARHLPSRAEAEDFLFREAGLIDAWHLDEWLALWDRDALYWIPCNDDDSDPETHVALIYERHDGLCDRIARLNGGFAFAQEPRTRTSHAITNVIVDAGRDGLAQVRSVLTLTTYRLGRVETFAGRVIHLLRRQGEAFRIVEKTVCLINNDGPIGNLTFII